MFQKIMKLINDEKARLIKEGLIGTQEYEDTMHYEKILREDYLYGPKSERKEETIHFPEIERK